MDYWSGLVTSTLTEQAKKVEDALERKSPFYGTLKARGNVEYNHAGRGHTWRIRRARFPVLPYSDGSDITGSRHDIWSTASLDWRAYNGQAMLTKLDKLANSGGASQLIDLFAQQQEELEEGLIYTIPTQILTIDGHAAANANRLHGIPSWFGYGAALDTFRMTPADTYANLSTAQGAVGGGTNETQDEYMVWTPTILDPTLAGWGGATATWVDNATEIIRYGINACQATNEIGRACDVVLTTQAGWRALLNQLDTKEQLTVERGREPYVSMPGFERVYLDGVEIMWDVHMPANTAYGLTMGDLVLMSMQAGLFGPDTDFAWQNKSWRWSLDFYGTFKTKTPRTHFMVINTS